VQSDQDRSQNRSPEFRSLAPGEQGLGLFPGNTATRDKSGHPAAAASTPEHFIDHLPGQIRGSNLANLGELLAPWHHPAHRGFTCHRVLFAAQHSKWLSRI